jgi:hypothetical protein
MPWQANGWPSEVLKMIIKREDWLARQAPKAPWPKITRQISPDPDNADAALVLLGVAAPDPTYADLAAGRTRLCLSPGPFKRPLTAGAAAIA